MNISAFEEDPTVLMDAISPENRSRVWIDGELQEAVNYEGIVELVKASPLGVDGALKSLESLGFPPELMESLASDLLK